MSPLPLRTQGYCICGFGRDEAFPGFPLSRPQDGRGCPIGRVRALPIAQIVREKSPHPAFGHLLPLLRNGRRGNVGGLPAFRNSCTALRRIEATQAAATRSQAGEPRYRIQRRYWERSRNELSPDPGLAPPARCPGKEDQSARQGGDARSAGSPRFPRKEPSSGLRPPSPIASQRAKGKRGRHLQLSQILICDSPTPSGARVKRAAPECSSTP
jgi:hypothetical protein